MPSVGIVGAGISGLHLALLLQRHGAATTVYPSTPPEQLATGRMLNSVCRFGRTRALERELGVDHWDFPDFGVDCAHVVVHADPPIRFCGWLTDRASFVDFRLYLPRLLEDYRRRGGQVVVMPAGAAVIERSARSHDLTVVAAGARDHQDLFPRDPDASADAPRRVLLAGLFHGVRRPDPPGLHLEIVPGAGEIFQSPVFAPAGRVTGLTFEGVPGGPWEAALSRRLADDPGRCTEVVRELLSAAGSVILDRIDEGAFALTGPRDLLQGALTPTVRRPWAALAGGGYAVALGDSAVLNDPVTGQGANLGSASARELAAAILAEHTFDESFCRDWQARLAALAEPVTAWTTAALGPPPAHVVQLLRAAAADQAVADAYLDNFDDPVAMWRASATPERTAGFVRRVREQAFAERERRFLVGMASGHPSPDLAPGSVLVTADGLGGDRWGANALTGQVITAMTGFRALPVTDSAVLVAHRLVTARTGTGPVYCSTLWHRTEQGWRVVIHQQSAGAVPA